MANVGFPLPLFLPLSFQIHTQFLIHASLSTKHLALPRFLSPLIPLFYPLCSPALSWPRSYDSTCLAQHALSDRFLTWGNKSLSSAHSPPFPDCNFPQRERRRLGRYGEIPSSCSLPSQWLEDMPGWISMTCFIRPLCPVLTQKSTGDTSGMFRNQTWHHWM